jgi:hypothetical protein
VTAIEALRERKDPRPGTVLSPSATPGRLAAPAFADEAQTADQRSGPEQSYGGCMATKSTPSSEPKKPSRTLKEKRAAKHAKKDAQKQARRGWEGK